MTPGIYSNIGYEEYNKIKAVRSSYLKKLGVYPAYAHLGIDPDSTALSFGRASHTFILEGDAAFAESFVVCPKDAPPMPSARSANAKKPSPETIYALQWWSQFNAIKNGKELVSYEDYVALQGMKESVYSHPSAKHLLSEGLSEQTVVYDADVAGDLIRCKVRPDRTPSPDKACLLDLKSCRDASYDGFIRACFQYGYFMSASMYIEGYNTARELMIREQGWDDLLNPPIDVFAFIAVEKEPPYRCEVYSLGGDNTYLLRGRDQYWENLRVEAECRRQGFYPNYKCAGIQELMPFSERENY